LSRECVAKKNRLAQYSPVTDLCFARCNVTPAV